MKLPGTPDICFVTARIAVFVDGCFWHGCPIHAVRPKENAEYWRKKLDANIDRDARVTTELEAMGWTVLRFWEHQINDDLGMVVDDIVAALGHSRL